MTLKSTPLVSEPPEAISEREQIARFLMQEARVRYGSQGKADIEEALERVAQLILRGEHER